MFADFLPEMSNDSILPHDYRRTEEYIVDAFTAQNRCPQVDEYHSEMIDPSHRYFQLEYAMKFRVFQYRCKVSPDYEDSHSSTLFSNATHRHQMDFDHGLYNAQYNFSFHLSQDLKSLSYTVSDRVLPSPILYDGLTNMDLLVMLKVPRADFEFGSF